MLTSMVPNGECFWPSTLCNNPDKSAKATKIHWKPFRLINGYALAQHAPREFRSAAAQRKQQQQKAIFVCARDACCFVLFRRMFIHISSACTDAFLAQKFKPKKIDMKRRERNIINSWFGAAVRHLNIWAHVVPWLPLLSGHVRFRGVYEQRIGEMECKTTRTVTDCSMRRTTMIFGVFFSFSR